MSDLGTCSGAGYGKCGRPNTEEDGWGFRACYGHMIIGRANKESHGVGAISEEEYVERVRPAIKWLKENPNE